MKQKNMVEEKYKILRNIIFKNDFKELKLFINKDSVDDFLECLSFDDFYLVRLIAKNDNVNIFKFIYEIGSSVSLDLSRFW